MTDKQTYLGDAVYASFDGWQIKLWTGDGNDNVIYLEPSVLHALNKFVESMKPKQAGTSP